MENNYVGGQTTLSKYVKFSQYELNNTIDAYLNSSHISGEDAGKTFQDRTRPFFNIVTAIRNIWYRATDIDRKHIRIKAPKRTQKVASYAATLHLQDWMRRSGFGAFLNDWGRGLADSGSYVAKFVEKNGNLTFSLVPWQRLISDSVDFENNPKIEILYLTPAQLRRNKSYDQKMVTKLIETATSRETLSGEEQDNYSEYIKLYEVHGELAKSFLTGKQADEDEFVQQMHVVSFVATKEGKYDDYSLYKGRESNDPYFITHLIKVDGRAQSVGAVESAFDAQWMKNHEIATTKDYLDVASKLILQTSDGNFVGQNALNAIENGDILVHTPNAPLGLVNTAKPDITQLQNFGRQWEVLAKEITATPDALRGETQPSGTAWRQVEALRQESHSLFELMTENKALALEGMIRKYILPFIKKKIDTPDELAVTLDAAGLSEFDSMYVPNEAAKIANKQVAETILSNLQKEATDPTGIAYNLDRTEIEAGIKSDLSKLGSQRFIKPSSLDKTTWKEALKDLEWDVEVEITEEAVDKQNVLTTLTTVFQAILQNPMILQDPNAKMLFNRILEETHAISPLELAQVPPRAPQPQPVGGSTVGQPLQEIANANQERISA